MKKRKKIKTIKVTTSSEAKPALLQEGANKRGIIERLIKINKGNKVYLNPSKKPIL